MSDKAIPWMLHTRGATNDEGARSILQGVGVLGSVVLSTLCIVGRGNFRHYPDSTGALHDLRHCLQRVDQRAKLYMKRMGNDCYTRADTKLILSQYVATIKCLCIIDPPGGMMIAGTRWDANWEPEPTDAGPAFRTSKPSDVISPLVSIYDSKALGKPFLRYANSAPLMWTRTGTKRCRAI
ncbi:hypothetical protein BYT27DRAFT_7264542 [Phlegmacium glaucopus]|nr:hypothetical protein BYT27DRAFT_7264542 [Phlegmacium glaucopus]